MEINISKRKDPRLPLLDGCGQLCLSSNQITGFFNYQCLRKESIDTVYFLHGGNYQRREDLRLSLVVDCGQLCLIQSRLFNSSIFWKRVNWYRSFLLGDHWKVAPVTTTFCWLWLVVSLVQSDCRILWATVSLKITNQHLWFFAWR